MENEFTDFLNQNWNDKFKSGVTSSSLHLNASGSGGGGGGGASNASALNHAILQQYHQQTLRAANSTTSSTAAAAAAMAANYENFRLVFMQNRHSTTNAGQQQQQQASQHGTTVAAATVVANSATTAVTAATAAAATVTVANPSHPIQRNPSTTATCPKLIDIHSIKGNNTSLPSLPYDCQSKYLLNFYCGARARTRSVPSSPFCSPSPPTLFFSLPIFCSISLRD